MIKLELSCSVLYNIISVSEMVGDDMKEKFVQINLRITESTMEKLKQLAWLSGRSNKEGAGHCRIAKEILESVVVERLNGFKGV